MLKIYLLSPYLISLNVKKSTLLIKMHRSLKVINDYMKYEFPDSRKKGIDAAGVRKISFIKLLIFVTKNYTFVFENNKHEFWRDDILSSWNRIFDTSINAYEENFVSIPEDLRVSVRIDAITALLHALRTTNNFVVSPSSTVLLECSPAELSEMHNVVSLCSHMLESKFIHDNTLKYAVHE